MWGGGDHMKVPRDSTPTGIRIAPALVRHGLHMGDEELLIRFALFEVLDRSGSRLVVTFGSLKHLGFFHRYFAIQIKSEKHIFIGAYEKKNNVYADTTKCIFCLLNDSLNVLLSENSYHSFLIFMFGDADSSSEQKKNIGPVIASSTCPQRPSIAIKLHLFTGLQRCHRI